MNRMRRWSPGRDYTPAISGESWYFEDDDTLTVAVVLHGCWGTNRPELVDKFGPWDADVYQLWVGRIPKNDYYVINDLFDEPLPGPAIRYYRWVDARAELFDKPHRAVSAAFDHGEIVSRTALADIPGIFHVNYYGVIRYENRRDARAMNLWRQARLRGEIRQAAARRRWRKYRDAETWHPGSYKGIGRKYYSDRKDSR